MPSLRIKLRDPGVRPEFLELYDYYKDLQSDRSMPSRRDIDPTAVPRLLGYLSLIDVRATPPAFRYRLCGEYQVALIGQELTNKPVDAIRIPELRDQLHRHLETVVEMRQPGFFREVLASMPRRPSYQRLLLPLSEDGGQVNMVLLSTLPSDPMIRRAEDWLKPHGGAK